MDAQTPKRQRITILEKLLKIRIETELEKSIAAFLETPPKTPLPSKLVRSSNLESVAKSLLGPIAMKREMRTVCRVTLDEIQNSTSAFKSSCGSLGAILGYRFIYGNHEHQLAVKFSSFRSRRDCCPKQRRFSRSNRLPCERAPDWLQV